MASPTCSFSFSKIKPRSKRGSLAEFGPVLFVFLFFALFPLLDLMAVAVGTASISVAARQGASAAASSADYGTGITAMQRELNSVTNSGFGKFLNLRPVGGYTACGANLWVEQADFNTKVIQYCGPNTKPPAPIDTKTFIYEYACVATYQVGPLCNLGAIPFIGSVPGLGPPATIKYASTCAVEYPDGLSSGVTPTGAWASSAAF